MIKDMKRNSECLLPTITEAEEQKALFEWAEVQKGKYPEISLLYHVPNGGSRNKIEAVHLKKQGVKPGVPDLCLPVSRGNHHGLYIELKRRQGGKVSKAQENWLKALKKQGYETAVCKGWEEAANIIVDYLRGAYDKENPRTEVKVEEIR